MYDTFKMNYYTAFLKVLNFPPKKNSRKQFNIIVKIFSDDLDLGIYQSCSLAQNERITRII